MLGKSVYGLPEINREQIKKATLIASPGCYLDAATTVPDDSVGESRAEGSIKSNGIIADSLSGVSGAGSLQRLNWIIFFVECNESVRPYGVPKHRHLSEIEQELSIAAKDTPRDDSIQAAFDDPVNRRNPDDALFRAGKTFFQRSGLRKRWAKKSPRVTRARTAKSRLCDCSNERRCPTPKMSWARTSLKSGDWRLDSRTGPTHRDEREAQEDNLRKGASGCRRCRA